MPFELGGRPYDRFLASVHGRTTMLRDAAGNITPMPPEGMSLAEMVQKKVKFFNPPIDNTAALSVVELEAYYAAKGWTKIREDAKKWPTEPELRKRVSDALRAHQPSFISLLRYARYTGPLLSNAALVAIVEICRGAVEETKHFFVKDNPRECGNCNEKVENVGDFDSAKKGNGHRLCPLCRGSLKHIEKRRHAAEAEKAAAKNKNGA